VNGGPAFPCEEAVDQYGSLSTHEGMTLRDYFAAKALQGFCTTDLPNAYLPLLLAQEAYEIADAMLKARSK
jgi:hypothetical protein